MSDRPVLVAGNWKMNLLSAQARDLAAYVARAAGDFPAADVAVFPSFTLIPAARNGLGESGVTLGAQCSHENASGAHTGEVSAAMLVDAGCTSVLSGHSERRAAGETDEQVARKTGAALALGLTPIVCVGETEKEREAGATDVVLSRQIVGSLADVTPPDPSSLVVAYEPVWAIGTGKTASPDQAQEVHKFIRDLLAKLYDDSVAQTVRIQYGGSVKPDNSAERMATRPSQMVMRNTSTGFAPRVMRVSGSRRSRRLKAL